MYIGRAFINPSSHLALIPRCWCLKSRLPLIPTRARLKRENREEVKVKLPVDWCCVLCQISMFGLVSLGLSPCTLMPLLLGGKAGEGWMSGRIPTADRTHNYPCGLPERRRRYQADAGSTLAAARGPPGELVFRCEF